MAKEAYRIDISVAVDDRSEPALSKIEGKVSKLDKSVERTRKQLERMNRTRWQMAVHIADRASDALIAINARVQSISGKTFRFTVRVLDYATRPLRMIGRLVSGGMALLGPALGAAASGLAGLFQTAAKFEQSMVNVRMVTNANAQDFAALNQRARELGTSMPFTATQVADAMGSLAGAGFTAKQVLDGIGPALLLASAGQMDLAEAADLASGVLLGMRMPAAQLERVVDVMAKTAATANTSISQLGSAFSLAAPAAADANVAIEQMAAAIGVLSSHGIQGERAGKAMSLMLAQLNDTSSPAAKKLKEMGLNLWDAQRAFKGLTPFMAEVERKGLRLADVAHAFGTETADAASILLNMGSESFAAYVKQLGQAQGAAKKMSKIQEDTLLGSIRRLSGAWEGIAISIGMQAMPALRAWIDRIAEAFTQSNGLADMIGGKINHVFTKLLDIMDSDAWNNAGVFGKIRLLWDEIVVAPFNEWWSGGGRERVIEAAHKIGAALGGALGGYLMGALGMASKDADVDASPFVQAGSTAGRAFLEAFLEAFDAGKIVGKAIEAFKNVQPTWLGGDTSSPLGQTLALMMDAWILSKTVQFMGKGKKFYKNARKWIGGGSSATMAETTATVATRTARAGTAKRSPWYRRWLGGTTAADAMPSPAAQFPPDYRPAGKRYWRSIPLDRTYRRDEVVRMANAGQLGRYSELEKAFGGQPGPAAQFPRNYRPAGKRYWRSIPLDRTYSRDDVVRMANAGQLGRYNELEKASRGVVATPKTNWMPKWFQGGSGKGLGFLARTGGRVKLPFSFLLDAVNIAAAQPGEERNQAIGGTIGGWGGFAAGSAAGAAIGSVIPGVGTVIGGTVGGIIGSLGGSALGEWIGKKVEKSRILV
ncbi:phage tail tape measure protein [Paenibacillus thiaminolyticus]|uniref:phage tail tape measure protein n=1 Tax=Paenibacillus thiaminolyticus TaxID=49283 RepID=UPI003D2C81C7